MAEARKRGRRASWEDIFGDFDDEFDEMRRRMDLLMEQFMNGQLDPGKAQPMIYGFSMRVGPDGKPRIQEFGNAVGEAEPEEGSREPLTDIIEEKTQVRVIVELPGVEKEDIQLHVEDRILDIEVDREDRKFSKQLELPCAVDPDSAKASYKNGVLEVALRRITPKKRGKAVRIEG